MTGIRMLMACFMGYGLGVMSTATAVLSLLKEQLERGQIVLIGLTMIFGMSITIAAWWADYSVFKKEKKKW